jgi:hypothetical protein
MALRVPLHNELNLHVIIRVSPNYQQVSMALSEVRYIVSSVSVSLAGYLYIISSVCMPLLEYLHITSSLHAIIRVSSHYQQPI